MLGRRLQQGAQRHGASTIDRRTRSALVRSSRLPGPQLDGDQYQQLLAVQRHLLQVDQARAKAMEDVEALGAQLLQERRARAQAEQRAAELQADLDAARARVSELESNPAAASQQPPPQQQSAGAAQQPQQQPAAAAPPTNGAAAGAPRVGTITLNYYTGWHDAFIHYDADKKGWTSNPGVKLARGGEGNLRVATITANSLEFVMNNGHGEWDSPGRFTDSPSNYHIQSPGTYKLRSGRLERLSD